MINNWSKGFFVFLLVVGLLVGCSSEEEVEADVKGQDHTVAGNEPQVTMKEKVHLLQLTNDEEKLYQSFKQGYNNQVLKDATPITVMKLYLHAVQQKDYGTEYELYIDDPEHISWSKEQHLQDASSKDEPLLDPYNKEMEVEFVQMDETSGNVSYPREDESGKGSFGLIKNQQGIWKVRFMPEQ
ncbi:hypothetical protein EDD58_103471 [Hazenella coriacea]|uniref:Lipoprotein n=2 Tax=Hazenella coriacea TaxID=1179467 RepID=A0A4R3LC04_9BACL|nr:hypothetical protein EDD58_103471 [Hazenella coriacea]